jgi:pilus assembly protein CpaF
MVLMSGLELPIKAIREQVASALDLIVHLGRLRDGTRRVTEICEVNAMEGDTITLSTIYAFDYGSGFDDEGRFAGQIEPTGLRPLFSDELGHLGIAMPEGLLQASLDPFAKGFRS